MRLRACPLLCAGLVSTACLPGDDRPPPGSLLVTAVASSTTHEGLETDDGWTITFDRVVAALGDVRLRSFPEPGSDSCNDYAETYYEWLFDFTQVRRPEKVGLVFGLGTCSIEFRVRAPSAETVLGRGASELALGAMLIEASDPLVEDERAALVVFGRAEREGVQKRLEWVFRKSYEIERCPSPADDGFPSVVTLRENEALERTVEVRPEELFRRLPSDEAPFVFEPYAAADGDDDGTVTFAELDEAPAPADDAFEWPQQQEQGVPPPETLLELVYRHHLPRFARMIDSGPCGAEPRER